MGDTLLVILTAAGLATATGHRATIPAFVLGILHHVAAATAGAGEQPFFQLSQRFEWLAEPVVLAILGALALLEILAENNPDAPELVNLAVKAPKVVAGFIVAAAAVGTVSDSIVLLGASGVLGAGTALGVDTMRSEVKEALNETAGEATEGWTTKALGWLETAWAAVASVLVVVIPILAIVALATVATIWFLRRRAAHALRVPCPRCGRDRHAAARVCPHCRAAI